MPLFDFKCTQCGHIFEKLVKTDENQACPECGAASERQYTIDRPGDTAYANRSSVRFQFNYPEP